MTTRPIILTTRVCTHDYNPALKYLEDLVTQGQIKLIDYYYRVFRDNQLYQLSGNTYKTQTSTLYPLTLSSLDECELGTTWDDDSNIQNYPSCVELHALIHREDTKRIQHLVLLHSKFEQVGTGDRFGTMSPNYHPSWSLDNLINFKTPKLIKLDTIFTYQSNPTFHEYDYEPKPIFKDGLWNYYDST